MKTMSPMPRIGVILPDVIVPTGEEALETMLEAKERTAMNTTR
jgi:hypothetical protein